MQEPYKKIFEQLNDFQKSKFILEEKEFLIVTSGLEASPSIVPGKTLNTCFMDILGFIEISSGKKSTGKGNILWNFIAADISDENSNNQKFIFEKYTIYRVKGYFPLLNDDKKTNKTRENNLLLTEIISKNENNEYLDSLLAKFNEKKILKSKILGELVFDRSLTMYFGSVSYNGKNIEISIEVDSEDDSPKKGLKVLETIWKDFETWNDKLKRFAFEDLSDLADEWSNFRSNISEKEFCDILSPDSIGVNINGCFDVGYNSGSIFNDHTVIVSGTIKKGPLNAEI